MNKKYHSLKRSYYAFKTAEREFNKRKVNLKNEYSLLLHKYAKIGNIKKFNIIADDCIYNLGDEYKMMITSIKFLHNIN